MKKAFITIKEYASYRGVHRSTVIRWIKEGSVPAEQPGGKKGTYAIPAAMIDEYAVYTPAPHWPERPL